MRRAACGSSEGRRRPVAYAALGLVLAGLAAGCSGETSAGPPPITQARIVLTGGSTPPADDAPWAAIPLPDDWSHTRPSVGGDAWYRLDFQVPTPALTAIYIPRFSKVGQPFVNHVPVDGTARFSEPLRRLWYRPQYYTVPPALLRPGANVLHVRLRAYPDDQGGLSEVYVGDPEVLHRRWRSHWFRQVTAMQATTAITFALGALVLAAWWLLRWSSAYGYFGLAAMCWTLHSIVVLTVDIPVPVLEWEVLTIGSMMWVVVAMMVFALRFAELDRPRLERAAWTYAVVGPLLLWLGGVSRLSAIGNSLLLMLLAIGAYEFKVLWDVARRRQSVESILLVVAGLIVLALGAHDLLNRQGTFAYAEPFHMHYGVPVLFAAVFWNLLGQVVAGRRAAETLNVALETRVREKTAELELSYAQLRDAHDAETLAAERVRIMRDMHDGVGSQLIAARQLAGQGALSAAELASLLDECIDDLRLMIDSLEPTDGDLVTVLGNLRYRLTERLSRQGLAVHWEVATLPPTGLAPRDILQVLRIVQEAIANVLKHAGATELAVAGSLTPDAKAIVLSVRDNGRGFPANVAHAGGRGLGNMRQRAAAVGGTLSLDGGATGAAVTLQLPLTPPASRDAYGTTTVTSADGALVPAAFDAVSRK